MSSDYYPVEPAHPDQLIQPQVPQPMQPADGPTLKKHIVGFRTDEDRYIFFVNVAEMMYRDRILKSNSVSALIEHAAFETCNTYLFDLMRRVKEKEATAIQRRDNISRRVPKVDPEYFHIDAPPAEDF